MLQRPLPVIVITGPTASGKSQLALCVARALNGEIISADSMQIYRGLDVGTAKPTAAERKEIPHHLIDILDVHEPFSVVDFQREATKTIREVHERKRTAVVCGGTGQYIHALTAGLSFSSLPPNEAVRGQLTTMAQIKGVNCLWTKLCQIDPAFSARISKNDLKRIIRALEVYQTTGLTMTEHIRRSKEVRPEFEFLTFCLNHERSLLYERINQRVLAMLERGLLEEASWLMQQDLEPGCTSLQAIGYKEIFPVLQGSLSLKEGVASLQQATRRYAKRQLTWFRKMDNLIWLNNKSTPIACQDIVRQSTNNDQRR